VLHVLINCWTFLWGVSFAAFILSKVRDWSIPLLALETIGLANSAHLLWVVPLYGFAVWYLGCICIRHFMKSVWKSPS
jgi:hypothetical protein